MLHVYCTRGPKLYLVLFSCFEPLLSYFELLSYPFTIAKTDDPVCPKEDIFAIFVVYRVHAFSPGIQGLFAPGQKYPDFKGIFE